MNVALYARVSSEKQAEKDLSLPAQLKTLREYALKRNWVTVEEFIDEAESARTADRPAFQRMIASAKQKNPPFEAILVWKLNRFARNREDSIIYKSLLRKRGIQIISINENIDEGPTGKLLEGIIESIDEFYSANLSQDTVRGLKENTMRGFWNGGVPPFGYKFEFVRVGHNTKRKLTINESEVGIVKDIFALSLKGEGIKDIAKKLNNDGFHKRSGKPWTNSTIGYVLSNPIYTGCLFWNEGRHNPNAEKPVIKIPNTHPVIISEDTYEKARKKIYARTRKVIHPRVLTSAHLLSGFMKCKRCGAAMTPLGAKSGKFHYYICQTYLKCGREHCAQKMIPAKKIEPFITSAIKEKILTEYHIRRLLWTLNDEARTFDTEYEDKIEMINEVLVDKQNRRAKLYEGIETGSVELKDVGLRLKELNQEITTLETQKAELTKKHETGEGLAIPEEYMRPLVEDLRQTLLDGSIVERRGFIRSFIKKIDVDYPDAYIEYTVPLPTKTKDSTSTFEVLSLVQSGVGDGIRTRDHLNHNQIL